MYPRMRAKHQLQQGHYVEKLMPVLTRRSPELAEHLRKREIFVDYLFQNGIFTDPELDQLHRAVLNEYGARYMFRMQEYQRWGIIGDSRTLVCTEDLEAE